MKIKIFKKFCNFISRICPCFDHKCSQIVDAQQIEIELLKDELKELREAGL